MKEKILAVVIPAVIVPLVLIVIGTIYKMKEKSRNGEKPNNFFEEAMEFDLVTLAWVISIIVFLFIIQIIASSF
ncbi:MAG: hypothetical protein HG454_000750 [Clostridiales bacterium]|jgi:hypothetical protein|nr:hypothetical protein [Clostridiales bacterium]